MDSSSPIECPSHRAAPWSPAVIGPHAVILLRFHFHLNPNRPPPFASSTTPLLTSIHLPFSPRFISSSHFNSISISVTSSLLLRVEFHSHSSSHQIDLSVDYRAEGGVGFPFSSDALLLLLLRSFILILILVDFLLSILTPVVILIPIPFSILILLSPSPGARALMAPFSVRFFFEFSFCRDDGPLDGTTLLWHTSTYRDSRSQFRFEFHSSFNSISVSIPPSFSI